MVVNKLLDYLRFGELADLSISDIDEQDNLDKMFTYINRGLKKVNSELALTEATESFTLVTDVWGLCGGGGVEGGMHFKKEQKR